nr:hypothetical protein [Tanacetum cinerariifolium]
ECIVLGRDFKLLDDANILLRTPRQHNMCFIDLNNIVPHRDLTCLVAKESVDECTLWRRRLGHLNFKTMNILVRHNLVRGLPTKCFENDHTCTAFLKGKQHKASCKSKLVNSVTKPLHTLHMDLFGFLKSKDETSGILKKFITKIKNLKDLKVKIIRCDNGGEFRNKEMNDFCLQKGIKREFSNARTPRQNGVAERRNRTMIEAARIMLADAKLPVTFWAEAVNNACYVQNRTHDALLEFSSSKPQDHCSTEVPEGRRNPNPTASTSNTPADQMETLTAIEKGAGPNWLFDIDSLTKSMNYVPVDARTNSTNFSGTKDAANPEVKKDVSSLRYIALPNWAHDALLESFSTDQMETLTVESPIPTVSLPVPTACLNDSPEPSSKARLISKRVVNQEKTPSLDNILSLTNRFEDILGLTTSSNEAIRVEADVSNMETTISANPTLTLRIHKDHPKSQIISPVDTLIQTRHKSKEVEEQSFITTIYQKTDPALLQFCLFLCFLSQVEPKKVSDALQDPSWVEAIQEKLLLFKIQKVWTLVDCPKGVRPIGRKWVLKNKRDERGIVVRNKAMLVAQGHTQEEGIDYDEVFTPVVRIEAVRLFLAYASFMGFTVCQMDVKSAFLYGTIDEEVYVMQPLGFQDPAFLAKVYKVEKAMYGLHQAPRAWYGFHRGTIDQTLFIRRQREDFILV